MKVLIQVIVVAAVSLLPFVDVANAQDLPPGLGQTHVIEVDFTGSEATRDQSTSTRKTLLVPVGSIGLRYPDEPLRLQSTQAAPSERRAWIARHPVLVGALVGFGSGFLVGCASGDDGVFDDFTAEFNGWMMGGIGAGAGALVGYAVSLR